MLEWFLNPDHLPLVVGIQEGIYKSHGLDINLIQPEDHYDGFDDLKEGKIQMAINEPIHMIEHFRDDIVCIGTFFETEGGILVKKEALSNLLAGDAIRITTPASNPTTNLVATEILKKYFKTQNVDPSLLNVSLEETDFYHLKHLNEGYDAAWLCFENFEGIEAQFEGLAYELIDSKKANFPNFSALEMVVNRDFYYLYQKEFKKFIQVTNEIIADLEAGKYNAKSIYYAYSKEEQSTLMDAIIDDSARRFLAIGGSQQKWQTLYDWFKALGLTTMTQEDYNNMFVEVKDA